jgi:glycerol kinase
MEKDAGVALDTLRVDGGLTASASLMQMQADLLGVPVEVAADAEATLRGVCFLAARAIGLWGSDDVIERGRHPGRRVAPGPGAAHAQARLERFARAVSTVRGWHAGGL